MSESKNVPDASKDLKHYLFEAQLDRGNYFKGGPVHNLSVNYSSKLWWRNCREEEFDGKKIGWWWHLKELQLGVSKWCGHLVFASASRRTIKQILFPPDREIQVVDAARMDICIHVPYKQTGLAAFLFLFRFVGSVRDRWGALRWYHVSAAPHRPRSLEKPWCPCERKGKSQNKKKQYLQDHLCRFPPKTNDRPFSCQDPWRAWSN